MSDAWSEIAFDASSSARDGELWAECVRWIEKNNSSITALARALSVTRSTVQRWIKDRQVDSPERKIWMSVRDVLGVSVRRRPRMTRRSKKFADLPDWADCSPGERLIWIRNCLGLSRPMVAEMAGLSVTVVDRIENRGSPSSLGLCLWGMGLESDAAEQETLSLALKRKRK